MDAATAPAKPFGQRFGSWLNRRIPPQPSVRLSQANIFIFPTRVGFVFGILLVLLILGAINYQNALVYGVTFLLASLFVVAILYTFRNLSGLRLEVAEVGAGFVGEDIEFNIRIERPKGRGREGIQIGWPGSFKQWVEVFDTQAATVRLFVKGERRGWLRPGRLLVETYYPLGMLRAWTWVDLMAEAIVYPDPIFNDLPQHRSSRHRDEGTLIDPRGSDDFVDIRDYAPGDSIKNILWRNYARADQLVVKRYASYQEPRLWLDIEDVAGSLEERLSKLTGMCLRASHHEQEFGLRIGQVEVTPGVGPVHLETVLKELALYGQ